MPEEEKVASLPRFSEKKPINCQGNFSLASVASISSPGFSYSFNSSSSLVSGYQHSHHDEKVFFQHQESDNEGAEKPQSESPILEESLN
jgi:hypothetical protein